MLTNLLDELLPEDRAQLLALGRLREFASGEEITRQGTIGNCLFVVESGELAIVRRVPGDEEEVLDTAPAGTLVGELAVLDRRPRSASLRAQQPTALRVIELRAFESLTVDGGPCGHRILQAVAISLHHRLAVARQAVVERGRDAATATLPRSPPHLPPAPPSWSLADAETLRLLPLLPLFSTLAAGEFAALAAEVECIAAPAGAEITPPETRQAGAMIVLRGAVSPGMATADGRAVALPVVAPGGFVDYAAILGQSRQQRFWRCRSPTLIGRLPSASFAVGAGSGSRLLYALCRDLAITLRSTTGLAMHLGIAWDHAAAPAAPAGG